MADKFEAAVEELFEKGWAFQPDSTHPHNTGLGYYAMHLNRGAYGWYTHPDHPTFCRPAGDSRPRWMAAVTMTKLLAMRV